jgi:hypothetical protein
MTILLPNSTFLHIPRTGGTWVRKALRQNGLMDVELRSTRREQSSESAINSWHMIPERVEKGFCFVRHPVTWYQSYWSYKQETHSWSHVNSFDEQCADTNFLAFVEKSLTNYPSGYVTWLYEFYTDHAEFVGRQENLQDDLITALDWADEDYLLDDIESVMPENVASRGQKRQAKYSEDILRRVLETESKIITDYGYTRYLPPVLFL